jgi:hypothetical protein
MNYSDIDVPAYWQLFQVAYFLPVAGLLFLGVMVTVAASRKAKTIGRRGMIAIVSVTAATVIASLALQPAIQGFKDQRDRNFAAALQREYGATSSKTFSEALGLGGDTTAVLARNGQSTNVRFEVKDGVIAPITLSEAPYPKADEKP